MNYKKIYDSLIFKAQIRKSVDGYFENHHIIPKSMGGTDARYNLVKLTGREHFIAHVLLAKIYGGTQWYAVSRMAHQTNMFNSRLYEIAKREYAQSLRGVARNDETKRKISLTQKGKTLSEHHLKKLQESNSSESTCLKKSKALLGRKRSEEDRGKMSEGWAKRRFVKKCIELNNAIESIFKPALNNA